MSDKVKLDKLVAILALAFLFTIGFGLLLREKRTLNAYDKRKSVFRLALDTLDSMFTKPSSYKDLNQLLNQWVSSEVEPLLFVV